MKHLPLNSRISIFLVSLLLALVGSVNGVCRDKDARCFTTWPASWCNVSHGDVMAKCQYMCSTCGDEAAFSLAMLEYNGTCICPAWSSPRQKQARNSHSGYSDSSLYFKFDEIVAHKFTANQNRETYPVGPGVSVDPDGRARGMLAMGKSACMTIGKFPMTCVSDPAGCPNGITFSFFFNMKTQNTDITLLTSGAHGMSRGVMFEYISSSKSLRLLMKTANSEFVIEVPVSAANLARKSLVHVAFTWAPRQDLKLYISGSLVKSASAVARPALVDSYTNLRIGCRENGEAWDGSFHMDEFAIWKRSLTESEIKKLSDPVVVTAKSTVTSPTAPPMVSSEHETAVTTDLSPPDSTLGNRVVKAVNSSEVKHYRDTLTSLTETSILEKLSVRETENMLEEVTDVVDSLLKPDSHDAWEVFSQTDPETLPSLIHSIDHVLESITDHLLSFNCSLNVHHSRENYELTVKTDLKPVEYVEFTSGEKIVLSSQVSPDVVLVSNVLRGIGQIFPLHHNISWSSKTEGGQLEMSDHIIGVSLYPSNSTDRKEVNLTFTFDKGENVSVLPKCVFLDYGDSSGGDESWWSDTGCITVLTDTGAVCTCNHLTNFAILMQLVPVELSEEDEHALEVITFVGCTLSLLGAVLTVITFLFLKIYTDRILIHLNLAVSIIGAQILLLLEEAIDRGSAACVAVTVLLFYFHLAVFSWMLVEGVQLFLQIVVVFTSESRMKLFYTIGWGLPLVIAGGILPVFHQTLGKHGICWLSPLDNSIWIFAIPAILVVIVNLVILVAVLRVIVNLSAAVEEKKLQSIKTAVKASFLLLPLLGCTWLLGVLSVSAHTVVFQYLFAVTNSIQGLLIFIFHCIYNSEVRDVFLRRKSTWDVSRHLKTHNKVEPLTNIRPSLFCARPVVQGAQDRDDITTPPTGSSVVGYNTDVVSAGIGRRKDNLTHVSV